MESALDPQAMALVPPAVVVGVAVAVRYGEESGRGISGVLGSIADLWLPLGVLAWLLTFALVGGTSGALVGFCLLWYAGLFARIYRRSPDAVA